MGVCSSFCSNFYDMNFLRLIRLKNLIIIALTMLAMRYCIMHPMLENHGLQLQLPVWIFTLIVLATVLIAAAGYVINDYFDTRPDTINHPDSVIVGRSVSKRMAIALHSTLNALGVVAGVVAAFAVQKPMFSLIFILTTGMLWFYSTTYKRQLLIGNIIVALLSALVPLIPLVFEYPMLQVYWSSVVVYQMKLYPIVYWICTYAIFAFLLTLAREIIKDIEDFEGDSSFGRNTLPVYFDISVSKTVVCSVLLATVMLLAYALSKYQQSLPQFDIITLVYCFMLIVMPIFATMVILMMAKHKKHYHAASVMCKLIMLMGIAYTLVFRFGV